MLCGFLLSLIVLQKVPDVYQFQHSMHQLFLHIVLVSKYPTYMHVYISELHPCIVTNVIFIG